MLGCGAGVAEAGGAGGSGSVEGAKSGCSAGGVPRCLRVLGVGAGLWELERGPRRAPERRAGPRGDLGVPKEALRQEGNQERRALSELEKERGLRELRGGEE